MEQSMDLGSSKGFNPCVLPAVKDAAKPAKDLYIRAFKYKLYPNQQQEKTMRHILFCCRIVYNKAFEEDKIILDENEALYQKIKKLEESLTSEEAKDELTLEAIKEEIKETQTLLKNNKKTFKWHSKNSPWLTNLVNETKNKDGVSFLRECPRVCLEQKLRDKDRALRDGFDKKQPDKKMPHFKNFLDRSGFRFKGENFSFGFLIYLIPQAMLDKAIQIENLPAIIYNDKLRLSHLVVNRNNEPVVISLAQLQTFREYTPNVKSALTTCITNFAPKTIDGGQIAKGFLHVDCAASFIKKVCGHTKQLKDNFIYFPYIGWIRFKKDREIVGEVRNATVSNFYDDWHISICEKIKTIPIQNMPEPDKVKVIGLDLGVKSLIYTSDGMNYNGNRLVRRFEKGKKKLQRLMALHSGHIKKRLELSKKLESVDLTEEERTKLETELKNVKESSRYKKFRKRLAKHYERKAAYIRNEKTNFLSTKVSKHVGVGGVIIMEDLRLKNMTASARGTIENPGKGVRQKAGLNKSLLDQGLGAFKQKIVYKMEALGGEVRFIEPAFTSQTCSRCWHTFKKNRNKKEFECEACGYKADADFNASQVIKKVGLASAGSVKEAKLFASLQNDGDNIGSERIARERERLEWAEEIAV